MDVKKHGRLQPHLRGSGRNNFQAAEPHKQNNRLTLLAAEAQTKNNTMKVSEAYPSNYLKADDLQGRDVIATIESVDLEKIGQGADQDTKLVIGFRGKEKKLVCNKTNAGTISGLYGDETDEWIGKQIILTAREVEFQGKMTLAIRVSLKKPGTAAPKPQPEPADTSLAADNIPF